MLFAEVVSGILTISIGKEGLSPQVSETHLYWFTKERVSFLLQPNLGK